MEIISIAVEKGIKIHTVKDGCQLENTIQSKVMVMVFSMAAEIKRDLISKRTKEALNFHFKFKDSYKGCNDRHC